MPEASPKTVVILNPNAGSASQSEGLHRAVEQVPGAEIHETEGPDHGRALARAAAGPDTCVVAAGGDGTVNEVGRGVLEAGGVGRFGIVPLGTGNDLARTLHLPTDPRDAFAVVQSGRTARLDAIRVDTGGETVYALNAAAGGFSGQVDEVLSEEIKATWGPLAYLIGAVRVLPDLRDYDTRVAFDDEPPERMELLNLIVANGRTVAGGKRIAPDADPTDGFLDVVLVRKTTLPRLAEISLHLVGGDYTEIPDVEHRRVRRVHVASHPGMWFNVDGELCTKEPATFEVMPGALEVVVGPEWVAAH